MKTERNNVLVQITRPFGVMSLGPCIQPSMMLMYATSVEKWSEYFLSANWILTNADVAV